MTHFTEIQPGGRPFKKLYLKLMLWFTGRAIQAAAKVDEDVKMEFAALPDKFSFSLSAAPAGPGMLIGKDPDGVVKYYGERSDDVTPDLKMTIKSVEAFFLIFSFQESTPIANARSRLTVDGSLPDACAAVRILDIVQVYLLPKFIAKMAIKRYPKWGFKRHTIDRAQVYIRTLIGI